MDIVFEHFARRLGNPDVVPEALAHLPLAIEPYENRHGHDDLRRQPVLALDFAVNQDVELLVRCAQFDIRLQHHCVVSRTQGIQKLMNGDRKILIQPRTKILTFQHARQPVMPAEPHHVVAGHYQPLAVVADLGLFWVQDLVDLRQIRLPVEIHLLARKRRPRLGLSRGIPNHRGKITDQENPRQYATRSNLEYGDII